MKVSFFLAVSIALALARQTGPAAAPESAGARVAPATLAGASFSTGPDAMAVVTVVVTDDCDDQTASRVSSLGMWVDGKYGQELLLFPASRRGHYDALLGPFTRGRHTVELRDSAFWPPSGCARAQRVNVDVVENDSAKYSLLQHAPVIELRADTVGEQTDVPLFAYVEDFGQPGTRTLRYTVVFSNEDGGTQTRALFARWGRTTDIEQVYEATLEEGRVVREEFQGPDHETRAFRGRRHGTAPILLVDTPNNMVTDRGRGIAAVRPVPDLVDLSRATRESTMDERPWACDVMTRELAAEGKISPATPAGDRWIRQAPDPREHVYLEARLTLDRALAAAWVRDARGRRYWSNYEREGLAIDRNGWVRTAVAVGARPAAQIAEAGWACLSEVDQRATDLSSRGSCSIEATRAFALDAGCTPGSNLVEPATLTLGAGEEGRLKLSRVR